MTQLEKAHLDMKLEVVVLGVSDVDPAKAFYENLGWRLDIDIFDPPEAAAGEHGHFHLLRAGHHRATVTSRDAAAPAIIIGRRSHSNKNRVARINRKEEKE